MKLLTKYLTKINRLRKFSYPYYNCEIVKKNTCVINSLFVSYNNLAGYRCFSTNKNGDNFDKKKEDITEDGGLGAQSSIRPKLSDVALFENNKIRRIYDENTETWFFSVIDIIALLTDNNYQTARNYWKVLKVRLKKEGSEVVTNCNQMKLPAANGKNYLTDVANAETLFRLIQSVPSPKAEPFKLWLAKVGYERIQEIADPEISMNRARENWKKHGRSEEWIGQRMQGQEIRNQLTDYWKDNQIKEGKDFAILTNLIHEELAGVSIKEHKDLKGLKDQNLRDHMTTSELIFIALAELSTKEIAESIKAKGLKENIKAAKIGGNIAKDARLKLEKITGQKVISSVSYIKSKNTIAEESKDHESILSENVKNNKDLLGAPSSARDIIPNNKKLEPAQSSKLEEKTERRRP